MAVPQNNQSPNYKNYALIAVVAIIVLGGLIWAVGAFLGIGPLTADQAFSGQVVDKDGEPISNAVIVVENQSGDVNLQSGVSTASLTTTTNENGEFTTPRIATGNYTVYPRGAGDTYSYTTVTPPRTDLVFAPVANGSVEKGNSGS